MFRRLFLSRHADDAQTDPLFRMQPERWLESRLRTAPPEVLPDLRGDEVYSQVPALRIHPANEIVLRHLAPEVEWQLIALGEQWRRELKIVFRKRSG